MMPAEPERELDLRTVRLVAAVSGLARKDRADAFSRGWNKALDEVVTLLEDDGRDALEELIHLTREAMNKRRAEGKKLGGEPPYGYRTAADGETLVRLRSEQRVISIVRLMRARGMSLRAIAAGLAKRKIKSRTNKRFEATQIQRILRPYPDADSVAG